MDTSGRPIDFLLTQQQDEQAAKCFLTKAIRCHGVPEKVTSHGSEVNAAAIRGYNEEHGTSIAILCDIYGPTDDVKGRSNCNTEEDRCSHISGLLNKGA